MSDISVSFIHPTSHKPLAVTLDDGMTAQEAIGHLLDSQFVAPLSNTYPHYELKVKDGSLLRSDETLASANVRNGSVIRVDPATEAGAPGQGRRDVLG
jgi:hypothetical protein